MPDKEKKQIQTIHLKSKEHKIDASATFWRSVRYIDDRVQRRMFLFYLHDIHALYIKYLADLGVIKEFHKSRLKKKVLEASLTAQWSVKFLSR